MAARDGRFGSKVGQIGPQMGQIRDFFRSESESELVSQLKSMRIKIAECLETQLDGFSFFLDLFQFYYFVFVKA